MRLVGWLAAVCTLWALAAPVHAVEHTYFVGRGFDVGLWGTGVHLVPDVTNPKERAFDSIVRSPTTQGIGRVYYSANGLAGRPLQLTVDFNTYRFGAYLTAHNVGIRGLSTTLFWKGEWLLTGLLLHHMKRGDNVRELGIIAYYSSAGVKANWNMVSHLKMEADLSARAWMFHRGLRTAHNFHMPRSIQTVEPRVRVKWQDVSTTQEALGLPEGLSVMVEAGLDLRQGSQPWGGVGDTPDLRNRVGPSQFPRRLQAKGVFGRPVIQRRAWLQLQGEAGYGVDEDDLTRTRIGGLNPYTVALPGAAWGEFFCERFAMGHAEAGLFATPFLYTGVSVHGGVINDPHRVGRLDELAPIFGVSSETRIGLGRLGFVRFRVGGSPQVERKKTQGSLGFLFWWEIGNLMDRTLMGS